MLGGLVEILLFPVAAQRSEEAKLHYAFVYNEAGRVLYRYDRNLSQPAQFMVALKSLRWELYRKLKAEKCDTWSRCITDYMKETREWANCLGYLLSAEEETEYEDLLTIGEWVDSGQVTCENGIIDIEEIMGGYLPVSDQIILSAGYVTIKVERRSEFAGSGRSIEISDDGKIVGEIASGESLIWQRPAGIFELQLVPKTFVVSNPVPIRIDGESGHQYDFEIFSGMRTFELKRKIP